MEHRRRVLQTLRRIISEWKKSSTKPVVDSDAFRYLMAQYRDHRLTQQKLCKGPKELEHLAETYATYLTSVRQSIELHERYHAKGERTLSQTANMVGLSVPEKKS